MMMRMRTDGRMGHGMMQWGGRGMGLGPMQDFGSLAGDGQVSSDAIADFCCLGPMADAGTCINDDMLDDLDSFVPPMMDGMDMSHFGNMMGQGQLMQHRIEMMKKFMDQNPPAVTTPDSSK